MNQIQVIGTHNSYRTEPQWAEHAFHEKMWPGSLDPYYSHAALDVQLAHQQVRSVEYVLPFCFSHIMILPFLRSH